MGFLKGRSNSYPYFTPRMFFVPLPSENQKQKQDHLWIMAQEDWGGASVSPRASGPWWAAGCWLGKHLCGVWPAWCHGCRSWWGKGICAVPSTSRELGRYCLALYSSLTSSAHSCWLSSISEKTKKQTQNKTNPSQRLNKLFIYKFIKCMNFRYPTFLIKYIQIKKNGRVNVEMSKQAVIQKTYILLNSAKFFL